MIINQQDIDDFVQAFRRYYPIDSDDDATWISDDLLQWLSDNPQVVMAAGYQEFVAGSRSPLYRKLISSSQLEDISRPLFRTFDGSWIVPSSVGDWDSDEWDAFRLDGLAAVAEKQKILDEEMHAYHKKFPSGKGPLNDFSERQEELDKTSIEDCAVTMPSFEEMIKFASKFVNNPMVDQTTLVSPKLWTPNHQTEQKLFLQKTAGDLINELQSNGHDLSNLHWRELEELVAELLRSKGMEIHVVRENPQGGRDIIARAELVPGSEVMTIAIEVKHRGVIDRPILQQAIQQNRHFPAMMLVTSGRFTAGVIKEASKPENKMRVFLKDGVAIRDLTSAYRL